MNSTYLLNDFDLINLKLKNFINTSEEEKYSILEWRNHKSIRKWMYSDKVIDLNEHLNFIDNLKYDKKKFFWLAGDIGVVYLNRVDFYNKNAYLGIYLNPLVPNEGKGIFLGKALLEIAFEIIKLHSLRLEVIEDNYRARKFYEKLGFKEEGCLIDFVNKNGNWKNVIIMGKINNG